MLAVCVFLLLCVVSYGFRSTQFGTRITRGAELTMEFNWKEVREIALDYSLPLARTS